MEAGSYQTPYIPTCEILQYAGQKVGMPRFSLSVVSQSNDYRDFMLYATFPSSEQPIKKEITYS